MITFSTTLDQGGLIPVHVTYNAALQCFELTIHITSSSDSDLSANLGSGLRFTDSEHSASFYPTSDSGLHATLHTAKSYVELTLHHRCIGAWRIAEEILMDAIPNTYRLSIMELRMLGQFAHECVPYARTILDDAIHLYAPLTDLHTHLTSQIRATDLMDIAAKAGALYPVELLELLGLDCQHLKRQVMNSTLFTPAEADGLACERAGVKVEGVAICELLAYPDMAEKLRSSMEIAYDEVIPFDALERRIYRMRNPLAKNPALVEDMILYIAQDYKRQGILYAELAATAALQPEWLECAICALQRAEIETGVALRLLAALPRSLSPVSALMQLEIIKRIAHNPYIVGVDFLGYEANKTRNFGWAVGNIARYASSQKAGIDRTGTQWHFADDFIVRVHAGENGKNPDNVAEVLGIAEKYGVRVRVGHAAYGTVDKTRASVLAKAGLLMIEFNPDSNMAMNNIDCAQQLPIKQWADIPFVLASDGAGVYQTDNKQLLAAGIFAGLEQADLATMHWFEKAHIAHQQQLFVQKKAAYIARYGSDAAFITWLKSQKTALQNDNVMARLAHKRPLLIAGASGSSWARIDKVTQGEICATMAQLVAMLDPQKVYFAMGRIKQEGIGQALDNALTLRQEASPYAAPFDVVGMLSGHQNMPAIAEHVNHIVPLSGELMSVPTQMTALLKTYNGCALYIGGSAFTRDFITCSKKLAIPFGVMAEVAGASGEKAKVLRENYVFNTAHGMIDQVRAMMGNDVFL